LFVETNESFIILLELFGIEI